MDIEQQPGALEAEVSRHRDLRRALEAGVPPLATSLDGRTFRLQAPVGLSLRRGGYVTVEAAGGPVLGQVLDYDLALEDGPEITGAIPGGADYVARVRFSRGAGHGVVLGGGDPFHDAPLRAASPEEVGAWFASQARPRARLRIGEALYAPGVAVELDAGGFDRHTFLCGQSGSGKSYSLGVLLEQLLLETDLRIVVLDPNSDCTRMPAVREGADAGLAERWRALASGIAVRRAGGDGPERLRLRYFDLDPRMKAAVAGLDPIRDRDEYGALLDLIDQEAGGREIEDIMRWPAPEEASTSHALAARIRNLGLLDWSIWAGDRDDPGLLGELDDGDWRCLVVDLGSVESAQERTTVAAAVLKRLWQRRSERRPVLVVIDEAHNVCPQEPPDALGRLATDITVRIAAEGRKFGIYLLVSTQRPQKVHENVLSQADNLVLMRMNSAADLAHLAGLFSFVPASLLEDAGALRLGESIVAGKITPHPVVMRFGARVAEEGGGDVPSTWAR